MHADMLTAWLLSLRARVCRAGAGMSTLDEATDQRVVILERALSKLNRKQGLGYHLRVISIPTGTLD